MRTFLQQSVKNIYILPSSHAKSNGKIVRKQKQESRGIRGYYQRKKKPGP